MGGCANSKYAVDEDKLPKKDKKPLNKDKKNKGKNNFEEVAKEVNEDVVVKPVDEVAKQEPEVVVVEEKPAAKADKEDIEFIDKEEAEKQAAAAAAAAASSDSESRSSPSRSKPDDDTKKEVTSYQTTVVKHSQKEGDELLQHLRDEAFRTLQNILKKQQSPTSPSHTTTRTTTASTASSSQTTSSNDAQDEDIVQQIKAQVINSLGKTKQDLISSIIEQGADLIKENKVKSMNELQANLETLFPDTTESAENPELIKKVINSATGFLTAKGTDAGVMLSNILANVSSGLQGVMNETEKTTVKVTRTVTEQIMSGGQLKEITRVITSNEPIRNFPNSPGGSNIDDVLKNLSNGLNVDGTTFTTSIETSAPTKVINSGTTTTSSSTVLTEKYENVPTEKPLTNGVHSENDSSAAIEDNNDDLETKRQAEKVVNNVVHAAVEKMIDESNHHNHNGSINGDDGLLNGKTEPYTNGHHIHNGITEQITEENIKVEEESTVKTSTTKIIINGNSNGHSPLDQVQTQFYKHGKQSAEELVKKLNNDTNDSEIIVTESTALTN